MSILSERGSNACTVTRAVVSVGKLQEDGVHDPLDLQNCGG